MKSFQFSERTIICGQASEWDHLIQACSRDVPGTVIDLRTFLEIADTPAPKPPEGWGYRRLPLTGATVSEQDLDVFRREFFRKPQTVVVGPNESRASLLVSASVARLEKGGWNGGQRACDNVEGEDDLLQWLTTYLGRHGFEDASGTERPIEATVEIDVPTALSEDEPPSPPLQPTVEMEVPAELSSPPKDKGKTSAKKRGGSKNKK